MKYVKIIGYGVLVWLIPFVFSMFFFGKSGIPIIPMVYFKTLVLIVGNGFGVLFLYFVLRSNAPNFKRALSIGILWLVINVVLDLVILLPMSHMSLENYFMSIGLRYILIPVIAVGMDRLAAYSVKTH